MSDDTGIMQNINRKYVDEATDYTGDVKAVRRPVWMKWGAIAACLCLIIAVALAVPTLFGGSEQIATLDNGNEIKFIKSDGGSAQFDIAIQFSTWDLTEDEIKELFTDLPVTGYALFDEEDGSVLGFEGEYEDMKLLVSSLEIDLKDTVIDGEDKASDVSGVSVNGGYFTSGKNVIYYASFTLGESTVYIENAGAKSEQESVKSDITAAIQKIIALEQIDLTSIVK